MFPKAVLLAPARMGKRVSQKKGSMATQVLERLRLWSADRDGLWNEVLSRAARKARPVSDGKSEVKASERSEKSVKVRSLEKSVIAAIHEGDVHKALRALFAAPLAPNTEATFLQLIKLHPRGDPPAPLPMFQAPTFSRELVKTALASFPAVQPLVFLVIDRPSCSSVRERSRFRFFMF